MILFSQSKARLPDLIEAFATNVSNIVALFAAKGQAASEITAQPAA